MLRLHEQKLGYATFDNKPTKPYETRPWWPMTIYLSHTSSTKTYFIRNIANEVARVLNVYNSKNLIKPYRFLFRFRTLEVSAPPRTRVYIKVFNHVEHHSNMEPSAFFCRHGSTSEFTRVGYRYDYLGGIPILPSDTSHFLTVQCYKLSVLDTVVVKVEILLSANVKAEVDP